MSEQKCKTAKICWEIWLAAFGFVAAVVVLVIPQFVRARTSNGGGCINNLRMIDGAKQQWALEFQKDTNAIPTKSDVAQYIKDSKFPICFKGGKYTIGRIGENPTCSFTNHFLPQP